ncbi:large-conductance mechanosensitive channel protein MscL [Clostridium sp.]|uniref:large-conductance mechanosensitive channel protein MscL n=1 Tax=Clostridium sp. TaxID=1506 RepID=UPI002615B15A|nr:large-conductance mechanosensitive channel protein MscL [Clostridium sp.]
MKEKGKGFISEFKSFAMKGNVIDLAVGVIIGGAFNKIVSSLVADIIMPLIGLLTGGVDFKELSYTLRIAAESKDNLVLRYGLFIQNIVDFLIIALSVFVMIKVISKLNKKKEEDVKLEEEVKEEVPTKEEILLTDIRDLLKERNS